MYHITTYTLAFVFANVSFYHVYKLIQLKRIWSIYTEVYSVRRGVFKAVGYTLLAVAYAYMYYTTLAY